MYLQSSANAALPQKRYGVLPGAYNPPTAAHLALAQAALSAVERVIFVLPQSMPHKDYSGVPFEIRLELLQDATAGEPRFSVSSTHSGLFIDISRELKLSLPATVDLHFLCGRDAAERIVNWDYGSPDAFDLMLEEFGLLVAPRNGDYQVSGKHAARIAKLDLHPDYQAMSATDVRERIRSGGNWEYLVPAQIRERVRALYGVLPKTL